MIPPVGRSVWFHSQLPPLYLRPPSSRGVQLRRLLDADRCLDRCQRCTPFELFRHLFRTQYVSQDEPQAQHPGTARRRAHRAHFIRMPATAKGDFVNFISPPSSAIRWNHKRVWPEPRNKKKSVTKGALRNSPFFYARSMPVGIRESRCVTRYGFEGSSGLNRKMWHTL